MDQEDNKVVDTVVANGATCANACALIWNAGWNKKAGVEAHIGVHGASNIDRNATDEQREAAEADGTLTMARTLADEGAPASIIAATAVTLPNEMPLASATDRSRRLRRSHLGQGTQPALVASK